MKLAVICFCAIIQCGCFHPQARIAPSTQPADATKVHARAISQAIADGIAFLQKSQNADGSWGTGTETRGTEVMVSIPGSHDAFRVAVTSLAVMALREAGETFAHDRGLEYLVTQGEARRATPALIYNIWAHIYAVQCLSIEMRHTTDPRIAQMARWHLDRMKRYQTYLGGWNYYDFFNRTQSPSMGATSFSTAAGLVALWEAEKSGLRVETDFVQRTLRRLAETRLPNGAYLYGVDYKYIPRLPAHHIEGSIGRAQACNYALWLWSWPKIGETEALLGLDQLHQYHDFINMGRKRPYPHESWYQTAGYYYYFGHYYAGNILERLSNRDQQRAYGRQLADMILPYQEPDGSWWDYAMWDYHKPYGTAFALMTLLQCQKAVASEILSPSR